MWCWQYLYTKNQPCSSFGDRAMISGIPKNDNFRPWGGGGWASPINPKTEVAFITGCRTPPQPATTIDRWGPRRLGAAVWIYKSRHSREWWWTRPIGCLWSVLLGRKTSRKNIRVLLKVWRRSTWPHYLNKPINMALRNPKRNLLLHCKDADLDSESSSTNFYAFERN